MKRRQWLFVMLLSAGITNPAQAQTKPEDPKTSPILLRISGEIPKPIGLNEQDLAKLPRKSLKAKGHDGKETDYEGVALVEVLKLAGANLGQDLRGPSMTNYLLVEASDGYKVVFALPELDPAWTDEVILLADRRDGKPLDAKEGPLRVIVPGEKRQGRWVRQVISLKVGKA